MPTSIAPGLGSIVLAGALAIGAPAPEPDSAGAPPLHARPDTVSFETDILPIFRARCAECHGGESDGEVITEAYLNLLSYEGVMAGSEYGLVIEPGKPDESILVDMIESGEMPEEGELVPPEEIELIRAWIAAGAPEN